MPRDGNGNYILPAGNPVVSGTTILSNWANDTMPDLGEALTESLSRTGQGGMLSPLKNVDGTLGAPAVTFLNEAQLGMFRAADGVIAFAVGSVETIRIKPTGLIAVQGGDPVAANDLAQKAYVDAFGSNLQGQIDVIDGEITVIDGRLDSIDGQITVIDGRLDTVEGEITVIDGRLNTIDSEQVVQNNRLDGIEGEITVIDGRLNTIDNEQVVQDNRLDAIEAIPAWPSYIDGYLPNGLHAPYTGDLDAIVVNSKYYVEAVSVTPLPAGFVGVAVLETDMTDSGTDNAVQLMTTMDIASAGAAFIRNKEAGVWSGWIPFGGGGGGGSALLVGQLGMFPFEASMPWMYCDGSAVSRTQYPLLFAALGVTYGPGDGATTFNLPDYRGQFMRGQDSGAGVDPNAATRTDRGDGVTGDNVGTKQASELGAHSHTATQPTHGHTATQGTHSHPSAGAHTHPIFTAPTDGGGPGLDTANVVGTNQGSIAQSAGAHTHPAASAGAITVAAASAGAITVADAGGAETRPVNINVRYYILSDV